MPPSAKSLILDLLSTLRREPLPVGALVDAGALFGLDANRVRVALARLRERGLVERRGRGLYRLAAAAAPVQDQVASWRAPGRQLVRWDGRWWGVHEGGLPAGTRARRRRARALAYTGLRALRPGLWLRPANLSGGVARLRERLAALGLEPDAAVFVLDDLAAADDARARALWDAQALVRGYRDQVRALRASERRLADLSPDAAMVETFRVGGRAIRELALDPLLPEPLVPAAERDALVHAMRRYDRLGRTHWRAFMRAHGAPHRRAPVDARVLETAATRPTTPGPGLGPRGGGGMTAPALPDARWPRAWHRAFTPEERTALLTVHPWRAWVSVGINWGLVFAAMAAVAWWPHPLTVIPALFVIGARQLGMAVMMHEAAHQTLFHTRRWNDWVGNWLQAYPVWSDVAPYRSYHLLHHARTGQSDDPDLGLITPFPITRQSLWRKVWRDLSGQTGWKQFVAVLGRDLGYRTGTQRDQSMSRGERADVGWHKLVPVALTNGALLGGLSLLGHPELYLLWVVAWFTTYRLVTRIRSIAEHALTPDPDDPFGNTRTTLARLWERLLIAPNRVNYHLEHHLVMTVPHYHLPKLHRMLRERGLLDAACVDVGYGAVLRRAASAPAA